MPIPVCLRPTIRMYDPVKGRPQRFFHIHKWTLHALCILVNQIKRVWQMTYSAWDLLQSDLSPQNVRYFSKKQYEVLCRLSNDKLQMLYSGFHQYDANGIATVSAQDETVTHHFLYNIPVEQLGHLSETPAFKTSLKKYMLSNDPKKIGGYNYHTLIRMANNLEISHLDILNKIDSRYISSFINDLSFQEKVNLLLSMPTDHPHRDDAIKQVVSFYEHYQKDLPQDKTIALLSAVCSVSEQQVRNITRLKSNLLTTIAYSKEPISEQQAAELREAVLELLKTSKECFSDAMATPLRDFFKKIKLPASVLYREGVSNLPPSIEAACLLAPTTEQLEADLKKVISTWNRTKLEAVYKGRRFSQDFMGEFIAKNNRSILEKALEIRDAVFLLRMTNLNQ